MKRYLTQSFVTVLCTAILVLGLACAAQAVSFSVFGINGTGVTADVLFTYDGSDTVSVTLTNTSPVGGAIVAFGFNVPSAVTVLTSFGFSVPSHEGVTPSWGSDFDPNNLNADALGKFDVAAFLTGGSLNAGGSPADGLLPPTSPGEIGTFTFEFGGTSLESLIEESFLSELSFDGGASGNCCWNFIVRFQGVGIAGSTDGDDSDFAVTPEPATALLLGSGLLGLLGLSRRRFLKKS